MGEKKGVHVGAEGVLQDLGDLAEDDALGVDHEVLVDLVDFLEDVLQPHSFVH